MAAAIDELLIAIGFEVDDEQARDASSMMGSLSDQALKLGGILSAGLGLNELTFGFAGANDQLAKFSRLNGVSVEEVDKLAYALQREGGSAQDAYRELENMNNILGRLRAGDIGWASELSRFGFDPKALTDARNLSDLVNIIAEGYQDLDAQQRLQVGNILGLGNEMRSMMMRGPGALAGYSGELERRGVIDRDETKAAEDFNDAVLNLQMTVRGFTKELSEKLLVDLTRSVSQLDEAILGQKDVAFDLFERYQDEIGDAFLGAAVIGAVGFAGKMFSMLGGLPNIILAYIVGNLASMWDWKAEDVSRELGIDLPDWLFKPIGEVTKKDVIGEGPGEMPLTIIDPQKSTNAQPSYGQQYGYPVSSPEQIRQSSYQPAPFAAGMSNQDMRVEVNNNFVINEANNASATAQKVSEDIKLSTETAFKKLGGNVQ